MGTNPQIYVLLPTYPHPSEPPIMARTNKPVAAPRNSTRGEVAIQEFANSNSTSEQLRQRAAPLLNSKELLRNVLGLTPEDQTKFVDKVDQVGRCSLSKSSLHYSCKGISDRRPTKRKICNRIGERVQCD